jgi:predicted CXXCH cytochrome family protein
MLLRFLILILLSGSVYGAPPALERARAEPCVAEPARMRRDHMEMLKHEREASVQRGEKGSASLRQCVECHASRESGSVAQRREDFCVGCHAYTGVKLDCFECHASKAARR